MMRFVMLLSLVAACETATQDAPKDAAACGVAPVGSGSGSGSAVDVPASAPCSTYEDMISDGRIAATRPGYRIIVEQTPFYPLWSASVEFDNGARTLVYGPQLAGDRLGAVGRVDNSENCIWVDAADY